MKAIKCVVLAAIIGISTGCTVKPNSPLGQLTNKGGASGDSNWDYDNGRMTEGQVYIENSVIRLPREVNNSNEPTKTKYRNGNIVLCLKDATCKKHLASYLSLYKNKLITDGENIQRGFYSDGRYYEHYATVTVGSTVKWLASLTPEAQQEYVNFKEERDSAITRSRKVEQELGL